MKKLIFGVVCAIVLLSNFATLSSVGVYGALSVDFKVNRVAWGGNINNPTNAYPGDTNVQLTVEVQNYSNETIKGVNGLLFLSYPFTDTYGKLNATASGTPSDIGNVMNQTGEILPAAFFTLTFSLNIDSNATPASYSYNMALNYFVKSGGRYLKGASKNVTVSFTVSKSPSSITCLVSPQQIVTGETVDISGSINPVQENVTVFLLYKRENGSRLTRTVKTAADGSYKDSYRPDVEGVWAVNASWAGDRIYKGSWTSASFEVRFRVSLEAVISENRLVAGWDNLFNITLRNVSNVSVSSIDAILTLPQPLIIQGNNRWSFNYFDPGSFANIRVNVFAPVSVIGSTYQGQLQVNYRDSYGQSRTDTFPVGLVVTSKLGSVSVIFGSKLVGGINNIFNVTLVNSGKSPLFDVDVTLTVPQPLVILGDNRWSFDNLDSKMSISIPVGIFVPERVIGSTYQGQLQIIYKDSLQSKTESYPVSLVVVGRVELVIYGMSVSPQPSGNGSRVSFTATILNKGNVKAMYASASILPNSVLELSDDSSMYIGEVEVNSPAPFTVSARVKSNIENGTYPVTVALSYRDDQYQDHSISLVMDLTVRTQVSSSGNGQSSLDLPAFIREGGWALFVALGAAVVILILYRRRVAGNSSVDS